MELHAHLDDICDELNCSSSLLFLSFFQCLAVGSIKPNEIRTTMMISIAARDLPDLIVRQLVSSYEALKSSICQ